VVAIMAKAPRAGRVKTRLSPPLSPAAAARLARCLLLDTVDRVGRIERARPALVYTPRASRRFFARIAPGFLLVPQPGGDLGRRLRSAFERLLGLGAGPVVVIGSDAPSLPTSVLEQALEALHDRHTDVVLGPSGDGGYYLVGLRRPSAALFTGIAWSTPSVLAQTLARARARRLRVTVLRRWWDVDTPLDLARLRRWLAGRPQAELPRTRRFLASAPDRPRVARKRAGPGMGPLHVRPQPGASA
jgi:rSAM/selenodomain-associated transferase 1